MRPTDPALLAGVTLFNARQFFEAHEVWEDRWRVCTGDERRLLHGLIQMAAAFHHWQRGTLRGVPALLARATAKLKPLPPDAGGLALAAFLSETERLRPGDPRPSFPTLQIDPGVP